MKEYERENIGKYTDGRKKRVAAYCRVSTDSGDQANSFESQRLYFREYIERNPDWLLLKIFADEGITGTNTKKRAEFNMMIGYAERGLIDLIITKEISRFARNTLDSIYYTRMLKSLGVGVIFMNDGINTLDGDSELRLAIMSSIAQEESRRTSQRVRWGQTRRMEQGVVFGRSMLGYDVCGGKMHINDSGAAIVRLIFHKFTCEGKGAHTIAKELEEEGFCPLRGNRWQSSTVLKILRNEKYCGDLVQKKTYTPDFLSHEKKYNHGQEKFIIIKNHHTPIISRDVFEKAAAILAARAETQKNKEKYTSRHIFSGKIKCGLCGSGCAARFRKRKNGSEYKAWRCINAVKYGKPHTDRYGNTSGCGGLSFRNEDIIYVMHIVTAFIAPALRIVKKRLMQTVRLADISRDTEAEENERAAEKRRRLIGIYTDGIITKEEFAAAMEKCGCGGAQNGNRGENGSLPCMADEISEAAEEIFAGPEYEDEFYRCILDRLIINENGCDVYLKGLPYKWSFTVKDPS